MNQLSVHVQDALGATGFEAALNPVTGEHFFVQGNAYAVLIVRPVEDGGTVRMEVHANGSVKQNDVPAQSLEWATDDALMLMLATFKAWGGK
jgi:hypothetical protein